MPYIDGIWQYSESDEVGPTFSDFLNLLAASVTTRIGQLVTELGVSDSVWEQVTLASGVSHYTAAPWSGLHMRRRHGVLYVTGAVVKASWANGDLVATLDVDHRPTRRVAGLRCQLGTNGQLIWDGGAVSGAVTLSLVVPL